MTDIVERLRRRISWGITPDDIREAADEIERLLVAIVQAKQNMDFGKHEAAHEILRAALNKRGDNLPPADRDHRLR